MGNNIEVKRAEIVTTFDEDIRQFELAIELLKDSNVPEVINFLVSEIEALKKTRLHFA